MSDAAAAAAAAELRALQAALSQGRFGEAGRLAEQFVRRYPALAVGWLALGIARLELGRAAEALAAFEQARVIAPGDPQVLTCGAHALKQLGRLHEAVEGYRAALELDAGFDEAHEHLGETFHRLGRPGEAEAAYRRALQLRPRDANLHASLGVMLKNQGRLPEAVSACQTAIALQPGHAAAHATLGQALHRAGRLADAEGSLRRALALDPRSAAFHSNLGLVLMDQGRMALAESAFRSALAIDPARSEVRSNLLFVLNHDAARTPADALEEARRQGAALAAHAGRPFTQWRCEPAPRRLRVGLVSGDLREHPVGHFLESVVGALDGGDVELFAYPTHHREDDLSARLRDRVAAWKPLRGLDDVAAAQRIHADGIHVLVDLAGHTAHNRLPLFALRPAPVQASWLGYFATTGLPGMDWLIADETGVPGAHEAHFSERVWRLGRTRLCFTPPRDAPAVAPLPAVARGHVTFGSFQNLSKVGDGVIATWARVLAALPGSVLRLQSKQLADPAAVANCRARFAAAGVAPERLSLHPSSARAAYLAAHAEVDLLLDTFPYPGGTTTCEALWMGVPTVTLAGDRLLARQGASLLTAAGLPQWVAQDREDYVARALAFASDLPALATLRAGLREHARLSPLFDAPGFARELSSALWGMWRAGPLSGAA